MSARAHHIYKIERDLEDARKQLEEKYRAVFVESAFGRDVLADILTECGFTHILDPSNTAVNALRNLAMTILAKAGIMTTNTRAVVDALSHYTEV